MTRQTTPFELTVEENCASHSLNVIVLQRRIKELETALGFYADKNSWVNSVSLGHPQIDGMTSLVELDKGDKARAALAGGEK